MPNSELSVNDSVGQDSQKRVPELTEQQPQTRLIRANCWFVGDFDQRGKEWQGFKYHFDEGSSNIRIERYVLGKVISGLNIEKSLAIKSIEASLNQLKFPEKLRIIKNWEDENPNSVIENFLKNTIPIFILNCQKKIKEDKKDWKEDDIDFNGLNEPVLSSLIRAQAKLPVPSIDWVCPSNDISYDEEAEKNIRINAPIRFLSWDELSQDRKPQNSFIKTIINHIIAHREQYLTQACLKYAEEVEFANDIKMYQAGMNSIYWTDKAFLLTIRKINPCQEIDNIGNLARILLKIKSIYETITPATASSSLEKLGRFIESEYQEFKHNRSIKLSKSPSKFVECCEEVASKSEFSEFVGSKPLSLFEQIKKCKIDGNLRSQEASSVLINSNESVDHLSAAKDSSSSCKLDRICELDRIFSDINGKISAYPESRSSNPARIESKARVITQMTKQLKRALNERLLSERWELKEQIKKLKDFINQEQQETKESHQGKFYISILGIIWGALFKSKLERIYQDCSRYLDKELAKIDEESKLASDRSSCKSPINTNSTRNSTKLEKSLSSGGSSSLEDPFLENPSFCRKLLI